MFYWNNFSLHFTKDHPCFTHSQNHFKALFIFMPAGVAELRSTSGLVSSGSS